MIDINKIVDVNFDIVDEAEKINKYGTAVYLTTTLSIDGLTTPTGVKKYDSYDEVVTEYKKYNTKSTNDDESEKITYYYNGLLFDVYQYFKNGGQSLIIGHIDKLSTENLENVLSEARKLTSDFIFVVINNELKYADKSNGEGKYTIKNLCEYVESLNSPYKVRLCVTTSNKDFITEELKQFSLAVKYNNITRDVDDNNDNSYKKIINAALLIPAYFSQVVLDTYNSIKDYFYTSENFYDPTTGLVYGNGAANNVESTDYDELIKNNYNFIDSIGQNILNFGGNYANGNPMTLDFGVIAMENEICNEVLNNIVGKQYLTENGLTNVAGIIDAIMQKYVNNGFLQVDASYSGNKYEYTYNGRKYLIVYNGELLEKGYKIYTIPISNISREDYKARKFTPIVIAMETNRGARTITIRGTVR